MRFVCDSCRAQYMISDDKVGPKGVKVRCKKCGHVILVRKTQDAAAAAAPAPTPDLGEERDETQVMTNPLASLGASLDQELTNPGAAAPQKSEPDPNSLLGASEDEIGAVFDSVLNSGAQKIPGAADENEEKTQAAAGPGGPALGGDEDDRMSTRVLDADHLKKLAAEAGLDGAPAAKTNGESRNGEKKDAGTDHDWYVAIDEKQVGPLKKEVVKEKWEAGEISADSLCWRAGFSDWIPVSEAQELAAVLAPRPNKPVIVASSPVPAPSVVSVPVESAFSSGGVTRTVRSEVPVPMAAAGASGDEAPSGWKPAAASALASLAALAQDDIEALKAPKAPPSPAAGGEGAMALGGGLLDLPPEEPKANGNGRSTGAHSPIFDEPVPPVAAPPVIHPAAPMNRRNYSQPPMPANAYGQPYAPYPVAPPAGNNKTLIMIGGGVVVLLLIMVGVIVWLATRTPAVAVVPAQQQFAVNQLPTPPDAVKDPPAVAKTEEKPVEKKAEEKPAETAKAEAKPEEKPAVEKKVEEKADLPKTNKFAAIDKPVRKTPKSDDDDAIISPPPKKEVKEEKPSKPIVEPKGTDDEFDSMFGGSPSKKPKEEVKSVSGNEEVKPKKSIYIPPAVGGGADLPEKPSNSDIIQAVQANVPAIKKCAAEQKAKDPSVSGKIVMSWKIQASGKASNVSVKTDEFRSSYMGACLGNVIKSMSFPKHKTTAGHPVDFPFTF